MLTTVILGILLLITLLFFKGVDLVFYLLRLIYKDFNQYKKWFKIIPAGIFFLISIINNDISSTITREYTNSQIINLILYFIFFLILYLFVRYISNRFGVTVIKTSHVRDSGTYPISTALSEKIKKEDFDSAILEAFQSLLSSDFRIYWRQAEISRRDQRKTIILKPHKSFCKRLFHANPFAILYPDKTLPQKYQILYELVYKGEDIDRGEIQRIKGQIEENLKEIEKYLLTRFASVENHYERA